MAFLLQQSKRTKTSQHIQNLSHPLPLWKRAPPLPSLISISATTTWPSFQPPRLKMSSHLRYTFPWLSPHMQNSARASQTCNHFHWHSPRSSFSCGQLQYLSDSSLCLLTFPSPIHSINLPSNITQGHLKSLSCLKTVNGPPPPTEPHLNLYIMHWCSERHVRDIQSFLLPNLYCSFRGLHLLFLTCFPPLFVLLQINSLLPVPHINSMLSYLSLLTLCSTLKILRLARRPSSHNTKILHYAIDLWKLPTVPYTGHPPTTVAFSTPTARLTPPQGLHPCLSLFLPGEQTSTLVLAEVIPLSALTVQLKCHLLRVDHDHHSTQGVPLMCHQNKRIKVICSTHERQRGSNIERQRQNKYLREYL